MIMSDLRREHSSRTKVRFSMLIHFLVLKVKVKFSFHDFSTEKSSKLENSCFYPHTIP
jgi:hypothetical protein